MEERTIRGVLHSVTDGTFYIESVDGEATILIFDGEHDTPIQRLITLKTYRADDGEWHVDPTGDYYTVEPERARAGPPGEKKRRHIALFRRLSLNAGEEEEARELGRVREKAQQLESFWKRFARHKWDVKVVGRTLRTDCVPDVPFFCKSVMRDAAKEIDEEGFDPNYFHMWSTHQIGDNWCGHADLFGDAGVTYGGRCDIKSTIHELGHNFGLHHANKDVGEGADIEYGDRSCIMGSGLHNAGLNSPHVLFLGLASDRETTELEQSAQLLLCPAELPERAMRATESKHVIVKPGNGSPDTYVSLRKGKGFPYLPTMDEKTVYLHTMDRAGKSALLGTVKPGETASLPGRVGLNYHEYDGETARITFDFRDGGNVDDLTITNGFPEAVSAVAPGPRHNGLWYDPDINGQGFDINIRNGKMSLIWYTFNEKNDSRRFYIGTCDLTGAAEEFDLYTTDNGTFDDPSRAETILAGRAQLYFLDDGKGVFNFDTFEHGRGSVEITSLAASNSPNSGLWFQPSREKEGFGVQFFDHLNSCIAYWYTYGSGRRLRGAASNMQRWFMCSGEKEGDEYSLTVYEVTGGSWLSFDPIHVGEVGTATLKLLDENRIDINYNVDTRDSIKGSGEYNLQRLL